MAEIKGSTPWAVVLCKFKDRPQAPKSVQYFRDLFANPRKGGLFDYWRDVSYGTIDLVGTTVFDWQTVSFTQAEAAAMGRGGSIQAAVSEARARLTNPIDFSPFYGIIIVFNSSVDSGSIGIQQLQGLRKTYGLMCTSVYDATFNAHEMGHGYGLDHSFDTALTSWDPDNDGTPGAYGDPYDIMSAKRFRNKNPMFQSSSFGTSGPGLNAPQLDYFMGWLPKNRVKKVGDSFKAPSYTETVTLAALNHPEVNGSLMAEMYRFQLDPPKWTWITVELRTATGWDRGITNLNRGKSAIVIHEVYALGRSYLIPSGDNAGWLRGEKYVDLKKNVSIRVVDIDDNAFTATVEIGLAYISAGPTWAGDVGSGYTWGNPFHPHPKMIHFA